MSIVETNAAIVFAKTFTLTLCLPKKFHAICTVGVQWTPDFKKAFGRKHLTQINKLTLKTVKNEQFKHKNK